MAYDEALAADLRMLLASRSDVTEKRMFGGLAFLVTGTMAVAAMSRGALMVRIPCERASALRARPGAEPMVMRGREVDGWLVVDPAALDGEALDDWMRIGVDCALALPPKRR